MALKGRAVKRKSERITSEHATGNKTPRGIRKRVHFFRELLFWVWVFVRMTEAARAIEEGGKRLKRWHPSDLRVVSRSSPDA